MCWANIRVWSVGNWSVIEAQIACVVQKTKLCTDITEDLQGWEMPEWPEIKTPRQCSGFETESSISGLLVFTFVGTFQSHQLPLSGGKVELIPEFPQKQKVFSSGVSHRSIPDFQEPSPGIGAQWPLKADAGESACRKEEGQGAQHWLRVRSSHFLTVAVFSIEDHLSPMCAAGGTPKQPAVQTGPLLLLGCICDMEDFFFFNSTSSRSLPLSLVMLLPHQVIYYPKTF